MKLIVSVDIRSLVRVSAWQRCGVWEIGRLADLAEMVFYRGALRVNGNRFGGDDRGVWVRSALPKSMAGPFDVFQVES